MLIGGALNGFPSFLGGTTPMIPQDPLALAGPLPMSGPELPCAVVMHRSNLVSSALVASGPICRLGRVTAAAPPDSASRLRGCPAPPPEHRLIHIGALTTWCW